jgi:3-isopropylmalate/(R)-2-methylmalate dehydratase large subunit
MQSKTEIPKTLFDKIWDAHVVRQIEEGSAILYIDRHYIHEVTSPQAFQGLRQRGLTPLRPQKVIATADHNVPTTNQHLPVTDKQSANQLELLSTNCHRNNITLFGLGHPLQGIVHVIGPELGYTLPGTTIVCGDSHTSTHGAFGTIAFGIGTSEVEMVLASQCLIQGKPRTMRIMVNGTLGKGVTSKDLILYIIAKLGTNAGTGYFVEFSGLAIESLSMESRMTLCNMSIELGARGGLIAPDETTYRYLQNTPNAPKNGAWQMACDYWRTLYSDPDAVFDLEHEFDASEVKPMVTYGTNPGMAVAVDGHIPDFDNPDESVARALQYMDFRPGETMLGKPVDYVFIGSCTNGRIEDLRMAASILKNRKVANGVRVWVVPGSKMVEEQAYLEGLADIFINAGAEFRQPGCSACLAMNDDKIPAGAYCVATSNRNFEGRQGAGARTILASPLTAAACAVFGAIADPRGLMDNPQYIFDNELTMVLK